MALTLGAAVTLGVGDGSDGNEDDGDGCNGVCEIVVEPVRTIDGGCSAGGAGGFGGLAAALGLLLARRRRRR